MITRYEHGGVKWVDIENPTIDEVVSISNEFDLGEILIDELVTPTAKPRLDVFPGFVYAVLHFPALRYTHGLEANHEIDIVFGKDFIITTHYATASATFDLAKALEAASLRKNQDTATPTGLIFLELTQRLYQAADHELDALEDTIETIEENIFSGKERKMVTALSFASRELLMHKRLLGTHHEILEAFEKAVATLFGNEMSRYVRAANTLHYRVHNRALIMNDIVTELRDTNMALLFTRQNEITKNLTIVAFLTFPLSVIAAVFGMNTAYTPVVNDPNGFWIIVGGMVVLTLLFFTYFKLKKWF
ncbi:MAG: CorA family divalent cation transporter [Patescibacteria group bacterium]